MKFLFTQTAQKDLKKLNKLTQGQILKKLAFYLDQPDPLRYAAALTNFSKAGDYRFRIGQYRVVFDVVDDKLYIHYIEHRHDIYRKK